jgi:hypothetical protein
MSLANEEVVLMWKRKGFVIIKNAIFVSAYKFSTSQTKNLRMKKLSKGVLLPLLLLLSFSTVWAQNKTITGKVLDDTGTPVSGATVSVKNSTVGTSTNATGDFTLSVPSSASTLVVSYVGYTSKDVAITGNSISVSLAKTLGNLDEVVVVGYGTQRKANVTGSISSVKSRDLEKCSKWPC